MPVLSIKNERAYTMASEIAKTTGHSLTQVVVDALEQYRSSLAPRRVVDKKGIREILARVDARPDLDSRSPDEIIGYNDIGAFD